MPNIDDARDTYANSIAWLASRDEFPHLLNERRLFGCGVEIGVQKGEFSEVILDAWRGKHLISVDPWMTDVAEQYVDIANVSQTQHNAFFEETKVRLNRFGPRSSIWRLTSLDAAAKIPDFSLDFVYIDARHDYASVLEDLTAWHNKVRPGGILAGHDYVDGHFLGGIFGVKSAVDEFFSARGIRVFPTLMDGPGLTWLTAAEYPGATAVNVAS